MLRSPDRGRSIRAAVCVLVTLATVAGPASAGLVAAPALQRFAPKGLGLSFGVPVEWGVHAPGPGLRFEAFAPGSTTTLRVTAGHTTRTPAGEAANYLAYQRQRVAKIRAPLSSSATRIAGGPAFLATIHWPVGIVELDYLFVRAGTVFVFTYSTSEAWLATARPLIAASVGSIGFGRAGAKGAPAPGLYGG